MAASNPTRDAGMSTREAAGTAQGAASRRLISITCATFLSPDFIGRTIPRPPQVGRELGERMESFNVLGQQVVDPIRCLRCGAHQRLACGAPDSGACFSAGVNSIASRRQRFEA